MSELVRTRRRMRVRGVVQGVGFRPFVYRAAHGAGLGGFVLNDGEGVLIEAEGPPAALKGLEERIRRDAPALAQVRSLEAEEIEASGERRFEVRESGGAGAAAIPPDAATCEECLRELFDPGDRRHRYPFICCTACGPRLTIAAGAPYDRARTTMAGFPLCERCRAEYRDPGDRRFHAEPIACPDCGPQLSMPVEEAVEMLAAGRILAIKGLGGYHLACDATDAEAVDRLRRRKRRERKPLAVMSAEPEALARLSERERELLEGSVAPIVLARRRAGARLAPGVSLGSPLVGVMLPYTPLHHLLARDLGRPLVMTSGNLSSEPIAHRDDEARRRLDGVADAFLDHDRPIRRRCEDSVLTATFPVRRSRGMAPRSLPVPVPAPAPLLATGAQLNGTFCVANGGDAFPSAHLGDLDREAALRAFHDDLELWLEMLAVSPRWVAFDAHPDYLTAKWAREQPLEGVEVQHHHAHAAACMAENRCSEALALVFDGTGFGSDGTLWGGELLRCDLRRLERLCHLEPQPLPGGEAAVRQGWRSAAAYLERADRPVPFERWPAVRQSLKVNAPLSSGMGRLFDAVSALLGVCEESSYEGQAAIELEWLAGAVAAEPYRCRVEGGSIRGSDLVAAAHDDLAAGRPKREIAAAFHEGVAAAAVRACIDAASPRTVALSGGCFHNLRLGRSIRQGLEREGFRVITHGKVPPGDGGISYGQAVVAAARVASCA